MSVDANTIEAAIGFLEPVLTRESISQARGQSIVDRLFQRLPPGRIDTAHPRIAVIRRALSLLLGIHRSLALEQDGLPGDENLETPALLYELKVRRTIYGLFDLISLEGIYPLLSPGVGIPLERRVKSVLPAGVITRKAPPSRIGDQSLDLLQEVVESLQGVYSNRRIGLGPICQERTLVDLISATGELAFGDKVEDESVKVKYTDLFKILVDEPSGVRQTIEFIASTVPPPPPETQSRDNTNAVTVPDVSRGPALPFEALNQASRLLSSIPSHLTPQEYFSQLAPQLFGLLDGEAGPEMAKASAFVIAGILGRKTHGAPGEAGWNVFAEPLLACLDPFINGTGTSHSAHDGQLSSTLVPESELKLSLKRLIALTTSHPNPSLAKRLIGRVFLPLWGLLCFAKKTNKTIWYEQTGILIRLYLKLSAGAKEIIKLAGELLFDGRIAGDGSAGWMYGPGREGGIGIRRRPKTDTQIYNFIEHVREINARVGEFLIIIGSGAVDDGSVSEVFLSISRRLLWQSHSPDTLPQRLVIGGDGINDSSNHLRALICVKIVQGLLEGSREKLAEKPTQMFELIEQLLEGFVERCKNQRQMQEEPEKPSLAGIGNIVQFSTSVNRAATLVTAEDESTDIMSIALSLLTTILSTFDSGISKQDENILVSIQNSLEFLSFPGAGIPNTLSSTATNLLSLLSIHSSLIAPTPLAPLDSPNPLVEDKKTYALALSYLGETLVPVRVQGLHLLEALIQSRSPLLDIQATVTLLLSLLRDEDEFIYLNAIKTLTILADRHGNAVTKALVVRYVDRGEDLGLDQRLRLGEALLRIVQRTGTALVEDTARVLGEGMMEVAGRRGQRLKEMEERQRQVRMEEARNREAEDAWGGEVPQISEDEERHKDEKTEALANIIKGWETKTGEEDVRVRTSALSICGAAIEANALGLGSLLISTAIDLAISILTIENQDQGTILRRAAAMLILSVFKALDEAQENGRNLGFGFAGQNLVEAITVLSYVQATDSDGLVREYAETIVKELETWHVKSLLRAPSTPGDNPSTLTTLGGRLVGLPLGNPEGNTRPSIEEIE
ncbi:hypothetical protein FGG08_003546 [Glutinoglossum americanum]|uniref:RNA polymerase II assembly factor Rtp1 C-terminal domain-containing protein n=1 Tax=Glutinoglossum americanum TaxID=1670608 RepID=A0A9P8I9D4_9PEZI|nr:hypothetical protein FGG08_003546 [Glutinoglossum americanum]